MESRERDRFKQCNVSSFLEFWFPFVFSEKVQTLIWSQARDFILNEINAEETTMDFHVHL